MLALASHIRSNIESLSSFSLLYLSMRGGLWDLRLEYLAPLFDRPHYQKPIYMTSQKCQMMCFIFFESGAFVCSITGTRMRSVAVDEAHEMLVNKDLKTTVRVKYQ